MKNLENTIKNARNLVNNLMNTEIRLTYSTKENFEGKIEVVRPKFRSEKPDWIYAGTDKKGRRIKKYYKRTQTIHIFVPVTEEKNVSYWYNLVFA